MRPDNPFRAVLKAVSVTATITAALLTAAAALAAEPVVRIQVTPNTINLGESARMQITVLVPTWQPEPPVYPSFEIPNVITRLPANSSHPTSERVGGETWSGIVRNYEVTPLLAADFTLGGESIRITWANPGSANEIQDAPVPAATLAVRVPAAAADLDPYLAGSRFTLERTIDESRDPPQAGDALVIRYRATLDGMPAIFIPPLAPAFSSDIATAYPAEPEITQALDGKGAERLEQVTLILNHGGQLELPGQTFAWWDTGTEQIREAGIPPLTLEVAGPPPAASPVDESAAATTIPRRLLATALIVALLAGSAGWRWLPGYLASRRRRAEAFKQSEAYAFRQLEQTSDARAAYGAALKWLAKLDPDLDLRRFAGMFGDSTLSTEVDTLSRGLFISPGVISPGAEASSTGADQRTLVRTFIRNLANARARYLAEQQTEATSLLAPLNPSI